MLAACTTFHEDAYAVYLPAYSAVGELYKVTYFHYYFFLPLVHCRLFVLITRELVIISHHGFDSDGSQS